MCAEKSKNCVPNKAMVLYINFKITVQFKFSRSVVSGSANPWITACQASLSITNSWSSLKLMSIKSVMPSTHLILFTPFFSCPQSLPALGSFPMSQLFAWGGQSIGISASASVLPMNTQDWSPLGWTGWRPRWATARPRSGQQPRGATARPRSGEAAEKSNPVSKEQQLRQDSPEELLYIQSQERRLWVDTPCPR